MTDPAIANRQSQIANPPTPIGIAVVEHAGRYLVGTRPEGVPLAGYVEFPGGKCLPGESPADCAVRECREETGLAVTPVELLHQAEFTYPHATVALHFWKCRPAAVESVAPDHHGYRWLAARELLDQKFPEANAPVIAMLQTARETHG